MSGKKIRLSGAKLKLLKHRTFLEHGPKCFFCKSLFSYETLTLEHLIPLGRGGHKTSSGNLALACKKCNNDKGSLTVAEYAIVLGLRPDHFRRGGRLRDDSGLLPLRDEYQIRRLNEGKKLPLLRK